MNSHVASFASHILGYLDFTNAPYKFFGCCRWSRKEIVNKRFLCGRETALSYVVKKVVRILASCHVSGVPPQEAK